MGWDVWLPLEGGGPAGHGDTGVTEFCKQKAQPRPAGLETAALGCRELVAHF